MGESAAREEAWRNHTLTVNAATSIGCGIAVTDPWFDSIRDKSFIAIANDNVKAKQSTATELDEED